MKPRQGSRGYQAARYRDHIRPAVHVYDHRVSATTAYRKEFGRPGRGWGTGVMPPDLAFLAQAARAASRGFVYARVAPRTGKLMAVPLSWPV